MMLLVILILLKLLSLQGMFQFVCCTVFGREVPVWRVRPSEKFSLLAPEFPLYPRCAANPSRRHEQKPSDEACKGSHGENSPRFSGMPVSAVSRRARAASPHVAIIRLGILLPGSLIQVFPWGLGPRLCHFRAVRRGRRARESTRSELLSTHCILTILFRRVAKAWRVGTLSTVTRQTARLQLTDRSNDSERSTSKLRGEGGMHCS